MAAARSAAHHPSNMQQQQQQQAAAAAAASSSSSKQQASSKQQQQPRLVFTEPAIQPPSRLDRQHWAKPPFVLECLALLLDCDTDISLLNISPFSIIVQNKSLG
ncbi:unnamed protein product [Lampetra planeri]